MSGAAIAKIAVGIIFLLFYIIRKAATKTNPPANFKQPNTPNPFLQNNPSGQNPFQNNAFQAQNNPFQQTPPPVQNQFQQQDAFTQNFSRNTNTNMGPGTQSFYCQYCGKKFGSMEGLLRDTCFKHPKSEQGLQKHVLYQGPGRPNVGF